MEKKAHCGYLTIRINGESLVKSYTEPSCKTLKFRLPHIKLPFLAGTRNFTLLYQIQWKPTQFWRLNQLNTNLINLLFYKDSYWTPLFKNYFTLDWKTSNGFSDINGNQPRIGLALKKNWVLHFHCGLGVCKLYRCVSHGKFQPLKPTNTIFQVLEWPQSSFPLFMLFSVPCWLKW